MAGRPPATRASSSPTSIVDERLFGPKPRDDDEARVVVVVAEPTARVDQEPRSQQTVEAVPAEAEEAAEHDDEGRHLSSSSSSSSPSAEEDDGADADVDEAAPRWDVSPLVAQHHQLPMIDEDSHDDAASDASSEYEFSAFARTRRARPAYILFRDFRLDSPASAASDDDADEAGAFSDLGGFDEDDAWDSGSSDDDATAGLARRHGVVFAAGSPLSGAAPHHHSSSSSSSRGSGPARSSSSSTDSHGCVTHADGRRAGGAGAPPSAGLLGTTVTKRGSWRARAVVHPDVVARLAAKPRPRAIVPRRGYF